MKTLKTKKFLASIGLLFVTTLMLTSTHASAKLRQDVPIGSDEAPLEVPTTVQALSNSISHVAEAVTPSVVSIHAEKLVDVPTHQYFNPFEDFFRNDPFRDFFEPRRKAPRHAPPKRQRKQQGMGSGVIVSSKGYVLTNHHVIGDADKIFVTLKDQRKFEAEIVGNDRQSDVAIIKIKKPPKNLPVVRIGNSDQVRIGEIVIAIGNPFGYSNTITSGIVSAKGRTTGLNLFENYIQTDAAINPGNSGGALLNLKGELIGINTAIASRSGGSQGIGFAIPINMARHIMEDILVDGKVSRGFLGVILQEMDDNLAKHFGLSEPRGALITKVIDDSPAHSAGIRVSDLIVEINGKRIKNLNHCRNIVALLNPDKSYTFKIIRNGKEVDVKVKIGTRQDELVASNRKNETAPMGLTVENIQEEHLRRYQVDIKSGVIVTDVATGSSADHAGFREGDVILKINNENVKSLPNLKELLKNSKGAVLVLIDRRGTQMFLGLKLG